MGVIYKITSPTGRLYVGKTYDLRKRINCHKCAAKKGSKIILHNSIAKYGWDKHVLEVIEEIEDDKLNEREIFWIKELKTYVYENPTGMNMTLGGDGQRTTWMHDLERRKKQSERLKGEGGNFYGKKHTEETKKFISEFMSKRNKSMGIRIPEWGAEKGRLKTRKQVSCYNRNGDLIKKYPSIAEAANNLNIDHTSISEVCSGNRSHVGGYIFKYSNSDSSSKIRVGVLKEQNVRRPVCLLSDNFDIITEYPSALEASQFWGIPKTTINRAAMYNWGIPIRTGHSFIYKDLYKELMQEVA